jgi:hypothetical protein
MGRTADVLTLKVLCWIIGNRYFLNKDIYELISCQTQCNFFLI